MLDKRYNEIVLDIKTNKANYPVMTFAKIDEETSDFYIQVNREGVAIDLTGCEITINVQKPNGNIESKVAEYDSEIELVYCNLDQNMKNIEGTYYGDLVITQDSEKIATPRFKYDVVNDIASSFGENIDEKELTTLQQLIADVQKVNYIDDENISETTTYSSKRIESIVETTEIGKPTDEQVANVINEAIANGEIVAGGITSTAKTLLINILRNAVYTSDQSANISALETALANIPNGEDGGSTTDEINLSEGVMTIEALENTPSFSSGVLIIK